MPDENVGTAQVPSQEGVTSPGPETQGTTQGQPGAKESKGPKSFSGMLEDTMAAEGYDFVVEDDFTVGIKKIEPLSKDQTIEGHRVEDLERIAGQSPSQTIEPVTAQEPTPEVTALKAQIEQRDQVIANLLQDKGLQQPSPSPQPQSPSTTRRERLEQKLAEAGYDKELAGIFDEEFGKAQEELEGKLANDLALDDLRLQNDLFKGYKTYGEDFRASLPAIQKIREANPAISIEDAYKGIVFIKDALGVQPQQSQAPTNGAEAVQKPIALTPEQARALLAKRDLMRTESGLNGTEARPANAKKQSFGEQLLSNVQSGRRAGQLGG